MPRIGVPTLVVREFTIDDSAADGEYLKIEGRASGLIAWLLTLLKLDPVTTLSLRDDRLIIQTSSLSGESHTVMPLTAIDSTQCGFSKAIWMLGTAGVLVLAGLSQFSGSGLFVGLLFGAIFGLLYFFSNKMFIAVSAGTRTETIVFKRGVIEGVEVNLERTLEAVALINTRVLSRRQ